jgi:hypothetical protein
VGGICGGKVLSGAGFSHSFSVVPCQLSSTSVPYSFIYHPVTKTQLLVHVAFNGDIATIFSRSPVGVPASKQRMRLGFVVPCIFSHSNTNTQLDAKNNRKIDCFVVQTLLNMFRALLCPSSGARQTAVATSGFRMNVAVEVSSAVVGLLVASSWVFVFERMRCPPVFQPRQRLVIKVLDRRFRLYACWLYSAG